MAEARTSAGTCEIHLAVAGDDAFAKPMAVTVRSAIDVTDAKCAVVVHVLDSGLTEESRAKLRDSWDDGRTSVAWYQADMQMLRGLPVSHHVSVSTYLRLIFGLVLPSSLDRVLYLDSDLLLLEDLGELWHTDLGGAPCAAAQDVAAPWIDGNIALGANASAIARLGDVIPVPNYAALGMSPTAPYFNAGVLLMELRQWRSERLSEQLFRCLNDHRDHIRWWDQYALNVVLHQRWHRLHPRWNRGTHILRYRRWSESPFDQETFDRALHRPSIVHFTTAYKPWLLCYVGRYRERWFETLDRTRWCGWRPGSKWERVSTVARGYLGAALKRLGVPPRAEG